MDLTTLRFIERALAVLIGGMAIYLGYRMFIKIPESRDSKGEITLPWNVTVILSRVGPGVFFALFGAAVVGLALYRGLESGERATDVAAEAEARLTGKAIERSFRYGAAPAASSGEGQRADARALLRRDIGVLNNLAFALRPDLPEHERAPIELAIPRIKLALMKPVWGEAQAGWGTPAELERWMKEGERDPAPPQIAQAVEYYRYARRKPQP